jgi:hypothetical protein
MRHLHRVVPLAVAAVVAGAVSGSAQFRASVDIVRVEALVADGGGHPIAGLTAADFRLTDNGAAQTITVRPLTDAEIDVVIALDTSLSVRGARLQRLRTATAALVERLAPRDRATLIAFNHELAIGPADAEPAALGRQLASLDAGGATSVLLIVFSDGRDTSSWTRVEQALDLARTGDAVVDAVVAGDLASRGPGLLQVAEGIPSHRARRTQPTLSPNSSTPAAQTRSTAERFLATLTGITSGQVLDGEARGLSPAFETSIAQFRGRYEITYAPTASTAGWHAIDVDVTGRRGASVHARRGYQR